MGRESRVRKSRKFPVPGKDGNEEMGIIYATAEEFAEKVALQRRAQALGLEIAGLIIKPNYSIIRLTDED